MQRRRRDCPRVLFRRRPRHVNPLAVVDELVHELAKEFEAACLLVVRMDHLLKKKVGINADYAEDSEVVLSQCLVVRLRSIRNSPARILLCRSMVLAPL